MIGTMLAGLGLNFVKDLISDKGEDLVMAGIKKVTGIDIKKKDELSSEDILKIKEAEFKLKQLDFDIIKADMENTNSARDMNSKIQTSEYSSNLAKNSAYYIDFAIIGGTLLVGAMLFFFDIPEANKDLAYTMFGSLITLSGTIINFHRGSSKGSKDKDERQSK